MTKKQREKAVAADIAKIKAKVLRAIKKRLRDLERYYGIVFVSFRLGITQSVAEQMLSGEMSLTMDQMSDLALAVGCRLDAKLHPSKAQ